MFLQLSEFLLPQFQFLVRVLDIPVMPQRRIRCAVLGLVVTRPFCATTGALVVVVPVPGSDKFQQFVANRAQTRKGTPNTLSREIPT